jgi:CheY-like chemotaxis protein
MNPLAGKSLAVINTSLDALELVRTWFEARGMVVHVASVLEFRSGREDLASFIARAAPHVIIYDVAVPYLANWRFLEKARQDGPLRGIPLIVTTPNARVLAAVIELHGAQSIHEIVGKPADMEQLTTRLIDLTRVPTA